MVTITVLTKAGWQHGVAKMGAEVIYLADADVPSNRIKQQILLVEETTMVELLTVNYKPI